MEVVLGLTIGLFYLYLLASDKKNNEQAVQENTVPPVSYSLPVDDATGKPVTSQGQTHDINNTVNEANRQRIALTGSMAATLGAIAPPLAIVGALVGFTAAVALGKMPPRVHEIDWSKLGMPFLKRGARKLKETIEFEIPVPYDKEGNAVTVKLSKAELLKTFKHQEAIDAAFDSGMFCWAPNDGDATPINDVLNIIYPKLTEWEKKIFNSKYDSNYRFIDLALLNDFKAGGMALVTLRDWVFGYLITIMRKASYYFALEWLDFCKPRDSKGNYLFDVKEQKLSAFPGPSTWFVTKNSKYSGWLYTEYIDFIDGNTKDESSKIKQLMPFFPIGHDRFSKGSYKFTPAQVVTALTDLGAYLTYDKTDKYVSGTFKSGCGWPGAWLITNEKPRYPTLAKGQSVIAASLRSGSPLYSDKPAALTGVKVSTVKKPDDDFNIKFWIPTRKTLPFEGFRTQSVVVPASHFKRFGFTDVLASLKAGTLAWHADITDEKVKAAWAAIEPNTAGWYGNHLFRKPILGRKVL